jgi:hypothetical protein
VHGEVGHGGAHTLNPRTQKVKSGGSLLSLSYKQSCLKKSGFGGPGVELLFSVCEALALIPSTTKPHQ